MTITLDKTVREIAVETPSSVRVFETLGIDYCCGGRKSLEQVCTGLHLDVGRVMETLERAAAGTNDSDCADWQSSSLAELAQYIVRKHHKYARKELVRLESLGGKVGDKHAHAHPELKRVIDLVLALRDELSMHMTKEEQVLFPYIMRLEHTTQSGQPAPTPPFGSVANPIRVMIAEHDDASSLLSLLRKLSNGYEAPADACPSYHAFYDGLREFERDLHQHIHLENNVLFPRALLLEQELGSSR
jgi:regulator of cell morphogenesis and NO signaling